MKYRTLLYLLLYSSPFINFSLIPGSNLPLAYIVTLVSLAFVIVSGNKLKTIVFGFEDLSFLIFLLLSLFSVLLNNGGQSGINQVINFFLTFLIYKTTLILLSNSQLERNRVLEKLVHYNTLLIGLSVLIFFIGMRFGNIVELTTAFFNNSGNFDVAPIATVFPNARIMGFSPEVSFWSFFVAFNLALALCMRTGGLQILVILTGLIFTFGRTGYLIGSFILVLKFFKGSYLQKAAGLLLVALALYWFWGYLNFNRLTSVDSSFFQRIQSLAIAFEIAMDHPFIGIGFGNFINYAISHELSYLDIFNLYLNIQVASGVFAFMAFCLTLFFIYRRIAPKYRLVFFAALIGWMTASSYNMPFIWFTLGILAYRSDEGNR